MAKNTITIGGDEVFTYPVLYVVQYTTHNEHFKVTGLTRAQFDCIHQIVDKTDAVMRMVVDLLNPKIKKLLIHWREMSKESFETITNELRYDEFMKYVDVIGADTMDRVFLSSSCPSKVESTFDDLEPVIVYHTYEE